jgi:mono/diheme cytochrome c family protein
MRDEVDKRAYFFLACCLGGMVAGCQATPPGKWETALLSKVKHSVTVGGRREKNPLANTPGTVQEGRIAFSHYCAACHGLDGQNTGVPFADRMSPPVPRLNSPQVQSYTDGQIQWVIGHGISPSGMPGSKGILTEQEIWSIVVFIRHLPAEGSLGEPQMYSGDDAAACPRPTAQVW